MFLILLGGTFLLLALSKIAHPPVWVLGTMHALRSLWTVKISSHFLKKKKVGIIIIDYKYSLWNLKGEEYNLQLSKVHKRSARRLLKCFLANGAIFIKVCTYHFFY